MKKIILLFLSCLPFHSFAHPVVYKGGFALNSSNMPDYSNNYIMYSFSNRFAIGADYWRFTREGENNEMGLIKLNHLLWRENGDDYQANIYLHGGLGVEDQEWNQRRTRGAYLLGVDADWETRILYSSFKYYQFADTSLTQARVGFSPKTASFQELQTWFMLQGMVIDDLNETVMITPMVRFFYHNVLWEVGSSTRGDWMLNLMVHY